jgi:potassium large conductance calcium-activated channel subfamily M alpha protein 1
MCEIGLWFTDDHHPPPTFTPPELPKKVHVRGDMNRHDDMHLTHRNQNQQRNSTVPNMVNSIKQVNKVKPNVTRNENIVSPGYNSR